MARKKKNKMPSKKTDRKSNIGKVYRGRTKYIDKDTKPERNYVVVVDDGKRVSVAKLKSIKIFIYKHPKYNLRNHQVTHLVLDQ